MKKFFITIILGTFTLIQAFGQATLPTVMVRPGTSWLRANGYAKPIDAQGNSKEKFDYVRAVDDPKMLQSITALESLLTNEGFIVKNLKAVINSIDEFSTEEMYMEDEDGNSVQKSDLDLFREKAESQADVFLDVSWNIEKIGPKKQLSYTIEGIDLTTGNKVCSIEGLGAPSMASTESTLLQEAVVGKIPQLKEELQIYLTDMLNNGREVYIKILVSSASNVHLQSPVEGGNIGRVITKWMKENAVQKRAASVGRGSRTSTAYNVHIPLYDTDELPMEAEGFAWQLSDFLSAAPYNLKTNVENQGITRATLTINGK